MKINIDGIEREATAKEITYLEAWQADIEAKKIADEKAISDAAKAKQTVLTKLGLTADEAALLLS
jgi:hypothetical protein